MGTPMDILIQPAADLVLPEAKNCLQKQLNYLCCLKPNIQDLADVVKEVEEAREGLKMRVEAAERKGEEALPAVKTWLEDAGDTEAIKVEIIKPPIPWIMCLVPRYSRSRKAKKTAESMVKLKDRCRFDPVAARPRPIAMVPSSPPPSRAYEVASNEQNEDIIVEAMSDREVNVIGVWVMGGGDWTVMEKRIRYRALKEGLFEEAVRVAAGQQADMLTIQHTIGDWLDMEFSEKTLEPRAYRLRTRLMKGKERTRLMKGKGTLIVIEDVWERIDLKKLGIPWESELCTVILMSHNMGVLVEMGAQRFLPIDKLCEENEEKNTKLFELEEGMEKLDLEVKTTAMSAWSDDLLPIINVNFILLLGLILLFLLVSEIIDYHVK